MTHRFPRYISCRSPPSSMRHRNGRRHGVIKKERRTVGIIQSEGHVFFVGVQAVACGNGGSEILRTASAVRLSHLLHMDAVNQCAVHQPFGNNAEDIKEAFPIFSDFFRRIIRRKPHIERMVCPCTDSSVLCRHGCYQILIFKNIKSEERYAAFRFNMHIFSLIHKRFHIGRYRRSELHRFSRFGMGESDCMRMERLAAYQIMIPAIQIIT